MSRKFFGTDGIRGTANTVPMTPEIAMKAGQAAGRYFTRAEHRHRVVIGKDTRLSGYMIEQALTAGFLSVGMDVLLLGPVPTPGVAILAKSMRADLGVMVSASHNSFEDNGIKLFGPDGFKLSDEAELEIEERMQKGLGGGLINDARVTGDKMGRAKRLDDALGRYIEVAKSSFAKGLDLEGIKVVVDCANGAAYKAAPTVLWELGAEVIAIGVDPNGTNINKGCGSTATDLMCETVRAEGADIGIALDGDADRLIICDETGTIVDGDQLLALIGEAWADTGQLQGGGVVATIMSNMGLEIFLKDKGLALHRTQVGDRYVVETMRNKGFNLGGEQSGHMVLMDYATTGDGLIAALQVLTVVRGARLVNQSARVSELCHRFEPLPQILKNVRYKNAMTLEEDEITKAVAAAEQAFGDRGRVVLRKSGTEPLVRVMAEGVDIGLVERAVDDIANAVAHVGGV
ncbi:MAG: phosphoglucosamine mutase [Alphaproteobacteria bacterium]